MQGRFRERPGKTAVLLTCKSKMKVNCNMGVTLVC